MSRRSKERGKEWERDVAKFFGGERKWAGPGMDVEVADLGLVIECKSQIGYSGLKKLLNWILQAEGYGSRWALAMRLGQRSEKREVILVTKEEYKRLLDIEREYNGSQA